MPESTVEYDARRAEMLTQLVLTRRKDLVVHSLRDQNDFGLDFLVSIGQPMEKGIWATFGVEVKATSEPLDHESVAAKFLTQNWKHRHSKGTFLFPVVVFLFSVDNDQGYWSWVMEPSVTKDRGPTLDRVASFHLKKITAKSIDALIDAVQSWYEAMVETIVKHESTK